MYKNEASIHFYTKFHQLFLLGFCNSSSPGDCSYFLLYWFDVISSVKNVYAYTLRPRQNWRHFADDIFKCIFLNENVLISLKISLNFVPEVRINNIPALVKIMAWRRPGDKPLSEPMVASLLTHICTTQASMSLEIVVIIIPGHGNAHLKFLLIKNILLYSQFDICVKQIWIVNKTIKQNHQCRVFVESIQLRNCESKQNYECNCGAKYNLYNTLSYQVCWMTRNIYGMKMWAFHKTALCEDKEGDNVYHITLNQSINQLLP